MTIFKSFKRNEATWYLVHKNTTEKHVERFNKIQCEIGIFANIAIKPYTGKKYNPQTMQYIVIG